MDAYEATKIVFQKIQNLDPQNASKIMGFLLIQDHGEKEMIRLAFGPESQLHSVILSTKKELNLASPNKPSSPSSPFSNNPLSLSRQNSSSSSRIPSPLSISNNNNSSMSSTANSSSWANSKGSFSDDLISPSAAAYNGEVDLIDELHLQDQLSFLNDGSPQLGPAKICDIFQQDLASSPTGNDPLLFAAAWGGGSNGLHHRRSCSVSDLCLGSDDLSGGFGWKPCLFYARGYCKNGTSCRFLHGGDGPAADGGAAVGSPSQFELMEQQCQEMLLRSKLMASNNLSFSSSSSSSSSSSPVGANKCTSFLQFQPDSPRGLMMGDGMHKFGGRGNFGLNCVNPGSRQIYLTFPADSTFKEEDVSNYFSNFGPVQDVRIPYQQKRMFGFVTFDFQETVKLILAKGNPHFVCDARVLVKPYKEKGKIPEKLRKQHQLERGDFTGGDSPTGLESRDPFDLGARMFYNTQDMMWKRKLEEQADLQQAIELQNRRLMCLQLLDVKRNSHHRTLSSGAVVSSPTTFPPTLFSQNVVVPSNPSSPEPKEENGSPGTVNEAKKDNNYFSAKDDQKNINGKDSPVKDSYLHESLEHNLPDSPFASPKAAVDYVTAFSNGISQVEKGISVPSSTSNKLVTGPKLFSANPSLDMSPFKSCYFHMPRFASGHETINGM